MLCAICLTRTTARRMLAWRMEDQTHVSVAWENGENVWRENTIPKCGQKKTRETLYLDAFLQFRMSYFRIYEHRVHYAHQLRRSLFLQSIYMSLFLSHSHYLFVLFRPVEVENR